MDALNLRVLDELVARLREGDRDACEPVFVALRPVLLRFAERMLGSLPDAEDVVQNAIEKIFSRIDEYDPARPALPWALGITAWECRTARARVRRKRETPLAGGEEPSEAGPAHASRALGPEEQFVAAELRSVLAECFVQLPTLDRETLDRAFFAETEGPKDSAFRKRKERALVRLRQLWFSLQGGAG